MERLLIHLFCAFIPSKEKRKETREKLRAALIRFKCRLLSLSEGDAQRIIEYRGGGISNRIRFDEAAFEEGKATPLSAVFIAVRDC